MDLNFTSEEEAFRDEVRAFIADKLPAEIRARADDGEALTRADYDYWQHAMFERGWGAPSWPREYGGPGWTAVQQYLFELECTLAGAPRSIPFGPKMVAPVLMAFGNDAQRERFLPGILSGEHWWCQGYSEPGAGSDLASLSTRAERYGDEYVVTGQKTWNTLGQYADWIFCLVRTAQTDKPQEGISFLLIDMRSDGITVKPIALLDGGHEVADIWFDRVRVPAENLVGEENKGWTYAKFLLRHERGNIAGVGSARRALDRLKSMASVERRNDRPLLEDAGFSRRVAEVEIELMALEITSLRVLSAADEEREPGPEVSILKIKSTEVAQAISELMLEALGTGAMRMSGGAEPSHARGVTAHYLNMRKVSIFAGSNEIQRNLIAKVLLGL
jgi:alkylation response protein AidB-like acyl-CoA dehydrogenase